MRYKITEDQGLRVVYGRGIARPDPYQLIPYITYDESANPPSFTVGDPSLKAEHANNYDVLYEHFLKPIGMFQAGFFYKQLTAPQLLFTIPIGTNLAALPAGSIPPATLANIEQDLASGTNTGGAEVTQYISGTNSGLYGVEAQLPTASDFPSRCARRNWHYRQLRLPTVKDQVHSASQRPSAFDRPA